MEINFESIGGTLLRLGVSRENIGNLMNCIGYKNIEMLHTILADMIRDNRNWSNARLTPIHLATLLTNFPAFNSFPFIEMVVDSYKHNKLDINETTMDNWNAIHFANFLGNERLSAYLMGNGVDPNTLTKSNLSAFSILSIGAATRSGVIEEYNKHINLTFLEDFSPSLRQALIDNEVGFKTSSIEKEKKDTTIKIGTRAQKIKFFDEEESLEEIENLENPVKSNVKEYDESIYNLIKTNILNDNITNDTFKKIILKYETILNDKAINLLINTAYENGKEKKGEILINFMEERNKNVDNQILKIQDSIIKESSIDKFKDIFYQNCENLTIDNLIQLVEYVKKNNCYDKADYLLSIALIVAINKNIENEVFKNIIYSNKDVLTKESLDDLINISIEKNAETKTQILIDFMEKRNKKEENENKEKAKENNQILKIQNLIIEEPSIDKFRDAFLQNYKNLTIGNSLKLIEYAKKNRCYDKASLILYAILYTCIKKNLEEKTFKKIFTENKNLLTLGMLNRLINFSAKKKAEAKTKILIDFVGEKNEKTEENEKTYNPQHINKFFYEGLGEKLSSCLEETEQNTIQQQKSSNNIVTAKI